MVIEISPKERDESSDLTRLNVRYDRGSFDTPMRIVTRNDLNAKDNLGINIPLTRDRPVFIYEEYINEEIVNNILTKNGYLSQMLNRIREFLDRTETSGALKLFYPKLTNKLLNDISTEKLNSVRNFIKDLSDNINIDALIMNFSILDNNLIENMDKPIIPVLKIDGNEGYTIVRNNLDQLIEISSQNIPFVGISYASYPRANLSYNYIRARLDKIHENNKGIITLDAPRRTLNQIDNEISSLHYSSFIVSDLVSERFYPSGGGKKTALRIFDRKNLALPNLDNSISEASEDDIISYFSNDPRIQELYERFKSNQLSERDIAKNRGQYMSRIHENLASSKEYRIMVEEIKSQNLREYRISKKRLNNLLIKEKFLNEK
ncbi:MAG: hypothetical protein ACP5IB_08075 [Thermoplasmata archaeon]